NRGIGDRRFFIGWPPGTARSHIITIGNNGRRGRFYLWLWLLIFRFRFHNGNNFYIHHLGGGLFFKKLSHHGFALGLCSSFGSSSLCLLVYHQLGIGG